MRSFIIITAVAITTCLAKPFNEGEEELEDYVCDPNIAPFYLVADAYQCDKFLRCVNNVKQIVLCEDGFGVDRATGRCDLLARIDCGDRTRLQKPNKINPNCPRLNGYFELPGSCTEYIDCRSGRDYTNTCPAGTVFDAKFISCVHPDMSTREDCKASTIHNFTCPESPFGQKRLRFGDHDRLPHPDDCSKFYACLLNGQPRLSSCTKPDVFNPETGFCENFSTVKGCETYYAPEDRVEKVKVFSIESARRGRKNI